MAAIKTITPSTWSGIAHNATPNAAALGINAISGTMTFKTWVGVGETEPTGGQYARQGASTGFIVVPNNGIVQPMSTADGTAFGGTSTAYTGTVTCSVDVMFKVADLAALSASTGANDTYFGNITIGNGATGLQLRFQCVNHTGVDYKQRCGVKLYAVPTSGPTVAEKITGLANAASLEPELEFNKVYTITFQVKAGDATTGFYRIFIDKMLHSNFTNTNTFTTNQVGYLGTLGNTCNIGSFTTGTTAGIEFRVLPRIAIWNSAEWFDALGYPTVASNTGTTRVFNTCFTPLTSETTGGYPITLTKTTGTFTLTPTKYATSANNPCRSYLLWGGTIASGDALRVSSIDPLGTLEQDTYGNQFVGWTSEYVPTGSAVWGIRSGTDSSSYAIAVNYSKGILREGSTVGSGAFLFAMSPSKVYGVCLSGNTADSTARVYIFNLSDDYRKQNLVKTANLAQTWPATLGVQSAEYITGNTTGATSPQPSTMIAGRTWGLMVGDSYGTAYTTARGTVTIGITGGSAGVLAVGQTVTETGTGATMTLTSATISGGAAFTTGVTLCSAATSITGTVTGSSSFLGGGTITTTGAGTGGGTTGSSTGTYVVYDNSLATCRNNVGFHIANGAENHFIPNGYRPGKPVSTDIPDVTYQWSVGRSGLRVEDMDSTSLAMTGLRGGCVFCPCFMFNSLLGVTADNNETKLADWGTHFRLLRDSVLTDRNTFIWGGPVVKPSAVSYFGLMGADTMLKNAHAEGLSNLVGPKLGTLWSADMYDDSYPCFTANTVDVSDGFLADPVDVHITTGSAGARYYVSRLFGNVAGGFSTGKLRKRTSST